MAQTANFAVAKQMRKAKGRRSDRKKAALINAFPKAASAAKAGAGNSPPA